MAKEETKKRKKRKKETKPRPPSALRVLTDKQVCRILKLLQDESLSYRDIADMMGVSHPTIVRINHGRTYRHVTCD